jgi:uncharacterized protein YbjQ (UPF0145 family)
MPYSTDDFDSWNQAQNQKQPVSSTGHGNNHPALNADTEGMPMFAKLRLQEHIKKAKAPFTSNFTISELLLTHKVGYDPVAQVMGASVYHVGWQWMPNSMFYGPGELGVITNAHSEAWAFALWRLSQQANVAGTHAVVGVQMNQSTFDFSVSQKEENSNIFDTGDSPMIQVSLTGTAVRAGGQISMDRPLLSTLTAQELIALDECGSFPAGVVYGCCSYYQPSLMSMMQGTGPPVAWGTQWQNQELTDYTNGYIHARRTAVQRLFDQSQMLGAQGVLDVKLHSTIKDIERDIHDYTYDTDRKQAGLIITVEAVGTAIFDGDDGKYPPLHPIVDLTG